MADPLIAVPVPTAARFSAVTRCQGSYVAESW